MNPLGHICNGGHNRRSANVNKEEVAKDKGDQQGGDNQAVEKRTSLAIHWLVLEFPILVYW